MTRILLVATAGPSRVRKAAEAILRAGSAPPPDLTIASTGDGAELDPLRELPGVRVVALREPGMLRGLRALRAERFDLVHILWTGEHGYRALKLGAFLLGRRATLIDNGDGGRFRLTAPAFVRHALFRRRHPFPHDHWELSPAGDGAERSEEPHSGERILVIQSAEPGVVARGLDRLATHPVFHNPRYTVFARNRPEGLERLAAHGLVADVRVHDETRASLRHLLALRRERFDGLVLFLTGDPSYWKIKYFAFLVGTPHRLVFNEYNDCFFFSPSRGLAHLMRRLGERPDARHSRGFDQTARLALLAVKSALLPFRLVWLLGVWVRLRSFG